MPKNTKIFIVSLILFLGFFGLNYWQNSNRLVPPTIPSTGKIQSVTVGDATLQVEVVRSVTDLATGLSHRDQIGSDGMLFILPRRTVAGFWMKDMRIDLDMIWIRDNRIVDWTLNVPHQSRDPITGQEKIYQPAEEVDWVLEVAAGDAARLGLELGDLVVWR